jgi:hypothetical protein
MTEHSLPSRSCTQECAKPPGSCPATPPLHAWRKLGVVGFRQAVRVMNERVCDSDLAAAALEVQAAHMTSTLGAIANEVHERTAATLTRLLP